MQGDRGVTRDSLSLLEDDEEDDVGAEFMQLTSMVAIRLRACVALLCKKVAGRRLQQKRRRYSMFRSIEAKARRRKLRKPWSAFMDHISARQFRSKFRMSKGCFGDLCLAIEDAVGSDNFKSEAFLNTSLSKGSGSIYLTNRQRMHAAHKKTSGGYLSGELKVGIALRMLAGGTGHDMGLIFDLHVSHVSKVFHDVVRQWFCNNKVVNIDIAAYLNDADRLKETASDFGKRTGGVMAGCIGALDGWLVKIKKPDPQRDNVRNPGHYFCRKGFFAVNCQAMVDRKKRILWASIGHIGSQHDSSAVKSTSLYSTLEEGSCGEELLRKGYYFVGDSAYSLRPFLLVPYEQAPSGSREDNFNYYLSSSRIHVECAFGEIDGRWGILWRRMNFDLSNSVHIIDACMRLHNFIVNYRETVQGRESDRISPEEEREIFDEEAQQYIRTHPDSMLGVFGSEEGAGTRGRPRKDEAMWKRQGNQVRDTIARDLEIQGLRRPRHSGAWRRDIFNRVHNEGDNNT